MNQEHEPENLSGAFDEEYFKWSEEYDRETLRAREAMPQPLNVATITEKETEHDYKPERHEL